ncbi:MAG: glycosyl hydrolase [Spirochaetota bacterium]
MHALDSGVFASPPATFRGAYFWSINDRIDEHRLRTQIRRMQRQGQGGVFYHPRAGMTDEYLSRRYFDGVDAAFDECRAQGMLFYLYDEDRFPSGFAGGYVCAADERHVGRQLVRIVDESERATRYEVINVTATSRYNNLPYASLLSESAVDEFISRTHEAYALRYGNAFGSSIPAIFTDEPNFRVDRGRVALPWADDFPEVFRQRKGYEIMERLDAIFDEREEDYRRVRYDYWEVISSLFAERFTGRIAEWCEAHNLLFTGHFWEHVFPDPTYNGSVMPNYERMCIPGIDMLFHPDWEAGRPETQFGNDLIARELVSVGNQLGKPRLLSETHGAGGWDYEFDSMKRMLDWQFAHGINFVCQHLYHYSLRGYRKRDFPPSFGPHQPWSDSYRMLGDYIARLSYATSVGAPQVDVLVLHPSGSTWTEWDPTAEGGAEDDAVAAIASSVNGVLSLLSENQIACDLGDEHLLERHASVATGPAFVVGRMAYTAVVLPAMVTIRARTLALLEEFSAAGGLVFPAGRLPDHLEGREAPRLTQRLGLTGTLSPEELLSSLDSAGVERLSVRSVGGPRASLYYQRRRSSVEEVLFLANIDRSESIVLSLNEPLREMEVWDALDGSVSELDPQLAGSDTVEIPPAGSLLLRRPLSGRRKSVRRVSMHSDGMVTLEPDDWHVEQLDMNALVLKRCRVREGSGWGEEIGVLGADDELRDALGIERRGIGARQPWMYTDEERSIRAEVETRFTFGVASMPTGRLCLGAEDLERVTVRVNGAVVSDHRPAEEWYRDEAFGLLDIREHCSLGENTVEFVWSDYGVDDGMEWVFIVGDFVLEGIGPEFLIATERPLEVGEWTGHGRPYFSGSVRYSATVEVPDLRNLPSEGAAVLELEGLEAIATDILVNDHPAGTIGWQPYNRDIGRYLHPGANRIDLVLHNSLQNLLGPHDEEGSRGIVTPGSFAGTHDVVFDTNGFDGLARIRFYREAAR